LVTTLYTLIIYCWKSFTHSLFHHSRYTTAGTRPQQPPEERERLERIWTENFVVCRLILIVLGVPLYLKEWHMICLSPTLTMYVSFVALPVVVEHSISRECISPSQ
jgi:hypothetical protein